MNAAEVIQSAHLVNRLHGLLSWDLATLKPHQANAPLTAKLELITATPMKPSLWLTSLELETFVTELIAATINDLETLGINIDDVIEQYKNLGVSLTQGDKRPLDNPSSL